MTGRKLALTDAQITQAVLNISKGMYPEQACLLAGISHGSFYNYLNKAQQAVEANNGEVTPDLIAGNIFVRMLDAIKKADSTLEMAVVTDTYKKVKKNQNPIFGITFLSRRWRERWSEKVQVEDTNESLRIYRSLIEELKRPELAASDRNVTPLLAEAQNP